MSFWAKDVIVAAGDKRDSGIPFTPGSMSLKTRLRFGFPQLLTLTWTRTRAYTKRILTFFSTLMSFNADISVRPGGQVLGRTPSVRREMEEKDFGRWPPFLVSGALPGFPTQVASCCQFPQCLASRNLQNAHPFAEVSRMGGGGGWKGGRGGGAL